MTHTGFPQSARRGRLRYCDDRSQRDAPSAPGFIDSGVLEAAEPGVQRMHGHLAGTE